jgi:hypothetical protein
MTLTPNEILSSLGLDGASVVNSPVATVLLDELIKTKNQLTQATKPAPATVPAT